MVFNASKYCPQCGKLNENVGDFCRYCGSKFSTSAAEQKQAATERREKRASWFSHNLKQKLNLNQPHSESTKKQRRRWQAQIEQERELIRQWEIKQAQEPEGIKQARWRARQQQSLEWHRQEQNLSPEEQVLHQQEMNRERIRQNLEKQPKWTEEEKQEWIRYRQRQQVRKPTKLSPKAIVAVLLFFLLVVSIIFIPPLGAAMILLLIFLLPFWLVYKVFNKSSRARRKQLRQQQTRQQYAPSSDRFISQDVVREVFRRDHDSCAKCGAHKGTVKLHIHHLAPVRHSGPNTADNLVLLCEECHKREHGSRW
jgi:HNH endonuclease